MASKATTYDGNIQVQNAFSENEYGETEYQQSLGT
jgi:hypothetical protein